MGVNLFQYKTFLFISERKCSSTEGQDTFFSLNNLLDTEKKSNFVENFSE